MYKRESFEALPERAPYFWVGTPIGRLCFRRGLASQESAWLQDLLGAGLALHALSEEAADMEPAAAIARLSELQALLESAQGRFIARHWVAEEYELETTAAHRAGAFHPSQEWPADYPALDNGPDRYGWSALIELSEEGLDVRDILDIVRGVRIGTAGQPQPTKDDIREKEAFIEPPKALTISQ